jgi:hypothetical protein
MGFQNNCPIYSPSEQKKLFLSATRTSWHSVFINQAVETNFLLMGYLLIKKDDVKTFKSFLSGNEIEVGVRIGTHANIFRPDEEVYIFYGNDDSDSYKARITRQKRAPENASNQSFVMLGLVRR